MFTIPIKINGSTALSSTSTNTIAYTDSIPLTNKIYDGKNLALKVDIKTYDAATALSSDSGQLQISPVIAESPAGTYVTFINGNSGTTLVLTSGTSVSGPTANGSYYIPLSIVIASGVTEPLNNVPFIKFGYISLQETRPWQAFLCVG